MENNKLCVENNLGIKRPLILLLMLKGQVIVVCYNSGRMELIKDINTTRFQTPDDDSKLTVEPLAMSKANSFSLHM